MGSTTGAARVAIRQAVSSDARALAAFAAEAFADTFAADNAAEDMAVYLGEAFGEARQRAELSDPACVVLIAERDDELAGYAMLRDGAAPGGAGGTAPGNASGVAGVHVGNAMEIARLYAGKRWIGTGIGAALMQRCLDFAASRGREWVWLGVWERNARAIAFYARRGFVDVGSQYFQLGADRQTDRIMARRVSAQE